MNDNRKFKRTKENNNPTNPNGDINRKNREFDFDNDTIIEQKENK